MCVQHGIFKYREIECNVKEVCPHHYLFSHSMHYAPFELFYYKNQIIEWDARIVCMKYYSGNEHDKTLKSTSCIINLTCIHPFTIRYISSVYTIIHNAHFEICEICVTKKNVQNLLFFFDK
jgi:hypothetical protein